MKSKKARKQVSLKLDVTTEALTETLDNMQSQIEELKTNYYRNSMQNKGSIDALSNKLGNLKSDVQTIAKHVQNLEAEKEKNCSCHTNTQKTDKNATEGQGEGKKEYSETIITNEMFNEELERFLKEGNFIYWVSRYTSIDNSRNYICGMITELLNKINRRNQFNFIKELIKAKLKSKGEHYNKESDRYANIKDALARNKEEQPHLFINWTVVDKINSYKDKHIQWLIDTKGTEQSKNDLQEAYIDVICYCIMCYIYLKFNGEA